MFSIYLIARISNLILLRIGVRAFGFITSPTREKLAILLL